MKINKRENYWKENELQNQKKYPFRGDRHRSRDLRLRGLSAVVSSQQCRGSDINLFDANLSANKTLAY
jgi:hypothetical protein